MQTRIQSIKNHVPVAKELLKQYDFGNEAPARALLSVEEWLNDNTNMNRIKCKFAAGDVVNFIDWMTSHSEDDIADQLNVAEFVASMAYDVAFLECENHGHNNALVKCYNEGDDHLQNLIINVMNQD